LISLAIQKTTMRGSIG